MSSNLKIADQIKYNADGFVSAIAQQHDTGEVLMLAWMNKESLIKTLEQITYIIGLVREINFGEKVKHPEISKV